jgi:hypothetical protein
MKNGKWWIISVLGLMLVVLGSGCFIPPPPNTTVRATAPAVTVTAPAPAPAPSALGSGAISYPGHTIRYPLNITYPRTVTIYVAGHGLDPTVRLYDAYGRQLGFNDDGGTGLDSQLVLTLSPGSYIVEVAGYGSSTGPFTVSVR